MKTLSWLGIFRLGLVQTALGAIVVLTTSTLNRVMVVELSLPALVPGLLVGLHSAVQLSRPRWGYGSDMGGRRTPWIIGGMAALALGGAGASIATAWMATARVPALALAVLAYFVIGVGVGAAGTSLLALLAQRTEPGRRAPAASLVWLMMIAGFIITTVSAGHFLDPYSPARLVAVTSTVAMAAFLLSVVAVWGVERGVMEGSAPDAPTSADGKPSFKAVLKEMWADQEARAFTIFVFVSMLAYNTQDLILEPFAGAVFGLTPGESTRLSGMQHSGVFWGMLLVAFAAGGKKKPRLGSTKTWTVLGCLASGVALAGLVAAAVVGPTWPLRPTVFVLGLANGAFAVAAIGWMMSLAGAGAAHGQREGVRMGVWGGAQAIAFALGSLCGTLGVDLMRALGGGPANAYGAVFAAEAALFVVASVLALKMQGRLQAHHHHAATLAPVATLAGE